MVDRMTYESDDGSITLSLDKATRMIMCKAYARGANDRTDMNLATTCDEAVDRVWADIGDMYDEIHNTK